MHGKHEPTCSNCAKFVFPFGKDSPLADWGYCQEEVKPNPPTDEALQRIEDQVRKGDYSFLTEGDIPLYQAQDEGCEKFEEKKDHF